ncbi:hypothetical protein ACO0LG_12320 [Undibacterium sp. Ji42W]|uniref:hypothetical protein n=1 Tax=Undibacterium sp. Ji42W TaxID=3413039 RepID=UPI003BF0DC9A
MALLGSSRRWHIRDQIPLQEITRRLGISRNTVRRYLRSEVTEPAYAERKTASDIDKYAIQLSSWLKTAAGKNRKQRRSLKQLHLDLKEPGFKGSYTGWPPSPGSGRWIKLTGSIQLANAQLHFCLVQLWAYLMLHQSKRLNSRWITFAIHFLLIK